MFVDKIGTKDGDPLRNAIQMISFGAKVVPEFITNDVEADIIVVSTAARALHFLKETENATIAIFVFPKSEVAPANALAERYPGRVRAMGWEQFTVSLIALIAEKAKKEEGDANSARG
ncbi:MAG: hypothetical protein Q8P21_01050 [bacterium]|nr:hypothetical protein [bacterium]